MDVYIVFTEEGCPNIKKFETYIEAHDWKISFLLKNQHNSDTYIDFIFNGTCEYSSVKIQETA